MLLTRFIETTKIFGGGEGISALSPLPNIWFELYVPVFALLICLFGFRRLINEDYGLVLQGIRDNDRAVMSGAINIYRFKAEAIFIAGLAGAFAGAFMTHYYRFVGMPAFALDYSILPLTAAVLGGVGTFAGPAIGAFILIPLSEIPPRFWGIKGGLLLRYPYYLHRGSPGRRLSLYAKKVSPIRKNGGSRIGPLPL